MRPLKRRGAAYRRDAEGDPKNERLGGVLDDKATPFPKERKVDFDAHNAQKKQKLQAALAYAERGWHVFPLHSVSPEGRCSCGTAHIDDPNSIGKHPRTMHAHKDATTDPKTIEAWWQEWPEANIGIACAASGIVAIDIDPRNGGDETFAALEEDHGPVTNGLVSNTGSGGRHIIFAAPEGSRFPGKLGKGIDVKYNGYIVAPPSNHKSGGTYRWVGDPGAPLDVVPTWIASFNQRHDAAPFAHDEARGSASGQIPWEEFRGAVRYLSNEDLDYDDWLAMGFSIHHESGGSAEGFALFDEWSRRSSKYNARTTQKKWRTMGRNEGPPRTGLSVMQKAWVLGWRPPAIDFDRFMAEQEEAIRLFNEWLESSARVEWLKEHGINADSSRAAALESAQAAAAGKGTAAGQAERLQGEALSEIKVESPRLEVWRERPRSGNWQDFARRYGARDEPPSPKPSVFKPIDVFCAEYVPLAYVVEPVIRTNSIYTLTAKTGTGKTGFLVALALAVASGRSDIIDKEVTQGRVAYIACENPDDIRMRMMITAYFYNIDLKAIADKIVILDRRERPEDIFAGLLPLAEEELFALVVVDTLQAFFDGDDSNNNVQVGEFIRRCRQLSRVAGQPAVIIASHPVKNASEDNLVPYGGGAILNEVDGNLTLWKQEGGYVSLSTAGKNRGIHFQPAIYRFSEEESPEIRDIKGRNVRLPVLRPSSKQDLEAKQDKEAVTDLALLGMLGDNPANTLEQLGAKVGITKGAVSQRFTGKLEKVGLVEKIGTRWRLTAKGRTYVDKGKTISENQNDMPM